MVLQAIKYLPAGASSAASLEILDQLALPHRSTYLPITSCEDAWDAIKQMKVRGAPAIAIVAALSLAVEFSRQGTRRNQGMTPQAVGKFIWERLEYLKSSRPTAVNLGDAVGKLKAIADKAESTDGAVGDTVVVAYIEAAEKMLIDDVKDNEAIGKYGARWIREHTEAGKRRDQSEGELKVMTHCNTGYMDDASLLWERS
jgi:methylthioribose-1-phosphate isomerase